MLQDTYDSDIMGKGNYMPTYETERFYGKRIGFGY